MSEYQNISVHSGVLRSLLTPGTTLQLRFISGVDQLEDTVNVPVVDAALCCFRVEAGTDPTIQACEVCLPTVLDLHALEAFQRPTAPAPARRKQNTAILFA